MPIVNHKHQSNPQWELASSNELSQQKINKILNYVHNEGQNLTATRYIFPKQDKALNDRKVTNIEQPNK